MGQLFEEYAHLTDVSGQLLEIRIGADDARVQKRQQKQRDEQMLVPLKMNGIFNFHGAPLP